MNGGARRRIAWFSAIAILSIMAFGPVEGPTLVFLAAHADGIRTVLRERPEQTRYWLTRCREHGYDRVPVMQWEERLDDGGVTADDITFPDPAMIPAVELERDGVSSEWNPLLFQWTVTVRDGTASYGLVADCTTFGEVADPTVGPSAWRKP